MLVAAPREGVGEIRATSGAMVQTGQVAFLPVDRPLTAVGVVEGRIDLRSLAKGSLVPATPEDGFEDELKDISVSGDSGLDRAGARAALYLQGKVKGSYLLTLAFDTEKDPGKQYMQDIQPDEFYPVYGDASVKEYGAQSYDRLYVRIDKDRNYFLYGDYQTPSPSQARQLGSYLRSLTGAVQHFENNKVQANAFASLTRITQVVDELPGLGISGPYQLSQPNARINSERIEILTRDRNQTQRVIRIVPLERYTDYTIEPFTGRILLRQPLASVDAQLNPISMRVSYEVDAQDAPQSWVYGADAQVHVGSFAEVGAAAIQDGNPYNARQIYSANVQHADRCAHAVCGGRRPDQYRLARHRDRGPLRTPHPAGTAERERLRDGGRCDLLEPVGHLRRRASWRRACAPPTRSTRRARFASRACSARTGSMVASARASWWRSTGRCRGSSRRRSVTAGPKRRRRRSTAPPP